MRRGLGLFFMAAAVVWGQEALPARASAAGYPARTAAGGWELGAEYHGHGLPGVEGWPAANEFVVIEVAVYPAAGEERAVGPGQFTLRLNGKRETLAAAAPAMVAASLRMGGLENERAWEAVGDVGTARGRIGTPPRAPRFPGDPTVRGPVPQGRAEDKVREVRGDPAEVSLARVGWAAETRVRRPAAGLLFFPYTGKLARIRSMELLWQSEGGEVVRLHLR